MPRTLFAVIFAGATFLLGTLLDISANWINVTWSVLDGLGAFVIDKVHPGSSMLIGPVPTAVVIWPLVVAVAAFLAVRFGAKAKRIGWAHPAAIILILTTLFWAPYSAIERALGANDPIWLSYYLAGE